MKKKLLLDENLPRPLKTDFSEEFEVTTVPDKGWANLKNGELLIAMTKAGINYLITVDKNLHNQQNLDKYEVIVVVLRTYDNRYETLKGFVPQIEKALKNMPLGQKYFEIDLRN